MTTTATAATTVATVFLRAVTLRAEVAELAGEFGVEVVLEGDLDHVAAAAGRFGRSTVGGVVGPGRGFSAR